MKTHDQDIAFLREMIRRQWATEDAHAASRSLSDIELDAVQEKLHLTSEDLVQERLKIANLERQVAILQTENAMLQKLHARKTRKVK